MCKKKIVSIFLALVMTAAVFSGCVKKEDNSSAAGTSAAGATKAEPAKLEPVTLKIMMPGDRPPAMEDVITEAEKRMADNINVKLNLVFIPWSDLAQKTQVTLSSGESVDLIFDAPWNHMREMIAAGYYEPLEDLLQKYGGNVLKTRPEQMWEANKFPGQDGVYRTYGIPLGNAHSMGKSFRVRKDIREKLGIAPIKTYDDLIKFWYAVREKEKNIVPLLPDRSAGAYAEYKMYFDQETYITPIELATLSSLYYKNNDGKVYNMFDEMEPKFWEAVLEARKLFLDGIIGADVMAVANAADQFMNGKSAAFPSNAFSVDSTYVKQVKDSVPEADVENVTFIDTSKPYISDFKQWNFQCIPVNSQNKERAMMFMDWANERDNYDLLSNGFIGVQWEPVGENKIKYLDAEKAYYYFPYCWIWNPQYDRIDAGFTGETEKLEMWLRDDKNFLTHKLIGFTFNPAPVNNEMSQFNNLRSTYWHAICNGAVDPE